MQVFLVLIGEDESIVLFLFLFTTNVYQMSNALFIMEMHLAIQSKFTGIPLRNNGKQIIIKSNIQMNRTQMWF